MALSDGQKKRIEDLALGEAITVQMSIHDQIAALRKQTVANSLAGKVPLVDDLQGLEDLVAAEKAKAAEKKVLQNKGQIDRIETKTAVKKTAVKSKSATS